MSDDDLRSKVSGIIDDCVNYSVGELAVQRAQATDYYKARAYGNEEDGRSQFVTSEVRDTVLALLPPVLRVFFGSDRALEFVPTNAQTQAQADQATDYVQYVFAEDNQGFLKSHSVLKDGLIHKLGIFKWAWEQSNAPKVYALSNVTQSELEMLASDDKVKLTSVHQLTKGTPPTPIPPQPGQPPLPAGQQPPMQPGVEATFDVECSVETENGRVRIWDVPPEEFGVSRNARTIEDALCVTHIREMRHSDLLSIGVTQEWIDQYGGPDNGFDSNADDIARRPTGSSGSMTQEPEAGEANDMSLYAEAYVYLDYDGDGIAELRRICTLGPAHWPIPGMNTPVDERPFSAWCPDPEPHTLIGDSLADRTMDIQRLSSMVMRCTLDSLALSVFPRMAYEEGQANVMDILNTEIGAPIRIRRQGAVQPLTIPWVGQDAIPLMGTIAEILESRTGVDKGTVGLDGDSLQSTGAEAAQAAITASQGQQELLARLFAEQALKPMFRGILGLLIKHQDKPRMLKLRGQWVDVDPRVWDANMGVTVNTGLGPSYTNRKLGILASIIAKQEQIMQTLGPSNPIVSLNMYSDALARTAELEGFKDRSLFFKAVDPNWQPPQPPPPPPSPEQIQANASIQIEQMKGQREMQIKEAELSIEQTKIALDHERRMAEAAANHQLARYELELKYHANISSATMNADMKREELAITSTIQAHDQTHDHAMQEDAQSHDQMMAEQQAAQPQGAPA